MAADDRGKLFHPFHLADNRRAVRRMLLQLRPVLFRELAGINQYVLIHVDFSQIVQIRGINQVLPAVRIQLKKIGRYRAIIGNPLNVMIGIAVPRVDNGEPGCEASEAPPDRYPPPACGDETR